MSESQKIMEKTEQVVLHTYNRFPVVFDHGQGVHLYDVDGKEYLDFGAGIAVFALGYGNQAYNQALKDQIDKIIHTSNLFYHKPLLEAAQKVGPPIPGCRRYFSRIPARKPSRERSRQPVSTPTFAMVMQTMRSLRWSIPSTEGRSAHFQSPAMLIIRSRSSH